MRNFNELRKEAFKLTDRSNESAEWIAGMTEDELLKYIEEIEKDLANMMVVTRLDGLQQLI